MLGGVLSGRERSGGDLPERNLSERDLPGGEMSGGMAVWATAACAGCLALLYGVRIKKTVTRDCLYSSQPVRRFFVSYGNQPVIFSKSEAGCLQMGQIKSAGSASPLYSYPQMRQRQMVSPLAVSGLGCGFGLIWL